MTCTDPTLNAIYLVVSIGGCMANEDWNKMVNLLKKESETNSIKIIRQESRETVLVNALVYFLHPRRGGKSIKHRILNNLLDMSDFVNCKAKDLLCIKTEFPCENEGRLDILLEFQNHCIGLEVKIDSDANNDFENYRKSVETRANAGSRSRKVNNFLIVKAGKTDKAKEKLGDEYKNWNVIQWGNLMDGCRLDGELGKKQSGIVDLLETLKKIDNDNSSKLDKFTQQNKIDEKAKKLQEFLEEKKNQLSAKKIFVWDSVDGLRQIYEPRVVVEFDSLTEVKVDVCVGFRGAQFVVFNKINSYDKKLYEDVCKNFRFYFWQDYQDDIEHYNRYLLANENPDCRDGNGPILPNYVKFPCSAGEEDSILVKSDIEEVDFNKEILKMLEDIRDKLVKQ